MLALVVGLITCAPDASQAQTFDVTSSTNLTSGTNSYVTTYVGSNVSSVSLGVLNTNTLLTNSGLLTVGNLGSSNSLVISNGGMVASSGVRIGDNSNSLNNIVLVTGTNSRWASSGEVIVGLNGSSNSLAISNAGRVETITNGIIGYNTMSSNNSMLVTGAGSLWTNSRFLTVGLLGSSNSLVISDGGRVANANGQIGNEGTSSNNSVLVTGAGSVWTNTGTVSVGIYGNGNSLVISDGGRVANSGAASSSGVIGFFSSSNSVLVEGTGSTWAIGSDLLVGYYGSSSSLVISNGGTVAVVSAFNSSIGREPGSDNNSVLVTGADSLWTNSNAAYVGFAGSGNSLVISNGGRAANSEGRIGFDPTSSNNSVLVTGAGSVWTNSSGLFVGNSGKSNSLAIADGGVVAASNVTIASVAGSSGTLNIGRFGTNDAAGTIITPTIAFGSGTGVINFNQSNATTITAVISGSGAVNQLGAGTTTLSGLNTYNGPTTISAGTLRIGDGGTTGTLGSGNVTNNAALVFNRSDTTSVGNIISGTGSLTQSGAGTLILSASNSYSGGSTVTGGTLQIGNGGAAGTLGSGSVTNNGSLVLNRSNNLTVSNSISGTGSLSKTGAGTATLTGNNAYTGLTSVNEGTLVLGAGEGDYRNNASDFAINNGSTLAFGGFRYDLSNQTNGTARTITFGASGGNTFDTGTEVGRDLGGVADWHGNTYRTTGGARNFMTGGAGLNVNTSTITLEVARGTDATTDLLVSAAIWNTGSLLKTGDGIATLAGSTHLDGSAPYAGTTTISAGTLRIGDGGTNGTLGLGNVTNNAALVFNRSDTTSVDNIISGTGSLTQSGAGTLILSASNSYSGATTIEGGGLLVSGSINSGNQLTVGLLGSGNSLVISNGGRVANTVGFIGASSSASNNSVFVTGAGSVWTNSSGFFVGNGSNSGNSLTVTDGGVVHAGGFLYVASNGAVSTDGSVWVGQPDHSIQAINILNSDTNSSSELVVNGTLTATSGNVTVAGRGIILGSGTVQSDVTIASGGSISPGNSPGTLNIAGNIDWLGGGNYNWQIVDASGTAGTSWDLISASGVLDLSSLTIGNEFNINLWSLSSVGPDVNGSANFFDNTQSYTWRILTAAGGITGYAGSSQFAINTGAFNGTAGFANALDGGTFSVLQSGNDLNLVFTAGGGEPVPEPGTWAAAALLFGGACFMRWRKRAKVSRMASKV